MAPKTSLRDNPPSASSSSSEEESGSGTEASGSTEYETEDEATKPNGKPAASSTLTSSPKKRPPGAASYDGDSGDESSDDSGEPNGKPSDSSGKAPSSHATKQRKTTASSTESDSESTDDEAAKPSGKLGGPSSKRPPSPPPKKKLQSEQDSGSDSETESSEGKAVRDRDQKPGSLSSKLPQQQQKAPIASGKREADKTPDPKSSKRAKREGDDNKKLALISSQDSERKNPFQRIFTDSDEIEILKGTAEFEEWKKENVVHDANDFYEFIKKRIETKFTKSQLLNKLQTMKKRFPGLVNKVKKGSKTLKPLDHTLYELSNKLWGPGGCLEKTEKELAAENATPTGKARKLLPKLTKKASTAAGAAAVMEVSKIDDKKSVVTSRWYMSENLGVCHKGGVDGEYMREVMDSVDEEEKADLEARWRKNQADMAKVVEERSRIAQQLCKLVDKHSSSSSY